MNKDEFFVGQYKVDIKRNQVVKAEQVVSMEPKVLEVLLVLAQQPGEVYSHQQIVEQVWPDSVVVQNALQRCIAQLRKAFGDDAKKQQVIATHPKKGYSLVADVRWLSKSVNRHSKAPVEWTKLLLVSTLLILAAAMTLWPEPSSEFAQFDSLTPITSSDDPEYYASFSPNGQHLAYTREKSASQGTLWFRDLTTNKEQQLTFDGGYASEAAWSENGDRIAYIHNWFEDDTLQSSVSAVFLPLPASEKSLSQILHRCNQLQCSSVQWLDSETIVFIAESEQQSQIIRLSLDSGKKDILFSEPGKRVYSLAYSPVAQKLAAMLQNKDKSHQLVLVDVKAREHQIVDFVPGKGHDYWKRWPIKWNAKHDGFITATDSQLLHVSMAGEVVEQPIPTYQYVMLPEYHPNGESIALTLGYIDRDITEVSWVNPQKPQSSVIERSIRREGRAQYQPKGEGLAFISDRSGSRQIWYSLNGDLTQVSKATEDEAVIQFMWSTDGKSIIALVNDTLYIADLLGKWVPVQIDLNVIKLFQWLPDKKVLLGSYSNAQHQVQLLDLESRQLSKLYNGYVRWSQVDKNSTVYLSKEERIVGQLSPQTGVYSPISTHPVTGRFLLRDNKLYWLTRDAVVRYYDIDDMQEGRLFSLDEIESALTDIAPERGKALFSISVSTNKEIVLLHKSAE